MKGVCRAWRLEDFYFILFSIPSRLFFEEAKEIRRGGEGGGGSTPEVLLLRSIVEEME